jgi:hypothetical protein
LSHSDSVRIKAQDADLQKTGRTFFWRPVFLVAYTAFPKRISSNALSAEYVRQILCQLFNVNHFAVEIGKRVFTPQPFRNDGVNESDNDIIVCPNIR